MSQAEFQASTPYGAWGMTAADAPVDVRRTFIRKTYTHLAAAVYAFVALEWLLFSVGFDQWLLPRLFAFQYSWLLVMLGFVGISWIADSWARSSTSVGMQYAGLLLYVAGFSVICVPLLAIAQLYSLNVAGLGTIGVIPAAGWSTLGIFGVLTAFAFLTKQDFSFLRGILFVSVIVATALVAFSVFTGFYLGVWFSAAMVLVACGYILYDTSNVIHHYRSDQHVAASLALFASVGLLFWYIVRLLMSFANRD
ncbi:MAG: Bax inhibitor-1 family protein [Pirellulales bacterium]